MKTSTHPSCRALFNAALLAASLLAAPGAFAQAANPNPPALMTYQGYLVNANGVALGDTTPKNYDVIFRIYDSANGAAVLWAEQQTVTVDKGNFSVLLGEGSSIGEARPVLNTVFDGATASDRYIGMTVKGIGAGGVDANILPRLRLLTSPYSYLAQKAMTIDGGAVTSGVVPDLRLSPNVALRNGGNSFFGNQILYNSLSLGVANPTFPLQFTNTLGDKISLWTAGGNSYGFGMNNSLLQIHSEGPTSDIGFGYGSSAAMTETMRIKGNGSVGIGVNPLSKLHVSGGDFQINGGGIYMDNSQSLIAKNSAGAWENAFIPRWSDNITYLTYGAGGMQIRNNAAAPTMFLHNNNRVGIGMSTLAPGRTLQVGSSDVNGAEGMIRLGSRSPSGSSARTWDIGVPQTADNSSGIGYSFVIDDPGINTGPELQIRWDNGYVGLNTSAPPYPLTVRNDTYTYLGVTRSDGKYAYFGRNANVMYLGLNQSVWNSAERWFGFDGDNNLDFNSDRKLKKDIVDAESVFDRAMKVQVRRYRWKDDAPGSKLMLGVIAQELQPLFPEMVSEAESPTTKEKSLAVGYGDFAVIAIKALQEFKQQHDVELEQLKSQLAALEKQNKELLSKDKERDKRLSAIEDMLRSQSRPEVKQAAFVIDGK